MKNEESKALDPMKRWISEAGTDTPGDQFHLSVLKKIEALPQAKDVYSPVISPLGWKIILGFITSIFVWSAFFVPAQATDSSLFDKLPKLKLPAFNLPLNNLALPSPDLSPNLLLGIAAFFVMGFLLIVNTLRNKQAEL